MNDVKLMDCTLRDGANVVGKGFSIELTRSMIEALLKSNIRTIELGNAHGMGANNGFEISDEDYLKAVQPYTGNADLGMFLQAQFYSEDIVALASSYSLNFLRVGNSAGDGKKSLEAVKKVKAKGMVCRYALMKAYIVPPEELAREAKLLADNGVDEVTIMDSAGTMLPDQVARYVSALVKSVSIPVAFHGHNNLGLATANALRAADAGARVLDCGIMGMARSAGNCATEVVAATLQRRGQAKDVDLYSLLDYIDGELMPTMRQYGYAPAITPEDLIYGLSGCHSSFEPRFRAVAEKTGIPLYRLIVEVSAVDQKAPTVELIESVAQKLA